MERYALFGGPNFYPLGGWEDFVSSHPSVDLAVLRAANRDTNWDWWHVIDLTNGENVTPKDPS